MKEAFWGVLIVSLGLLGIVIINVFQNITVGNDRTYYLLKETTEAAAYDAIDLTYYRLNADIRVVEDKYVENFARRFAENLGDYGNYYITIEEINETPPKISVKVKTSVTSLQGDTFGISNRLDGIIETKYDIEDITEFLDITEEEWVNRINVNGVDDKNACSITTYGSEEIECITGDLEFVSWEEVNFPLTACDDGTWGEESREVTYKVCKCGKWEEETEEVTTTPKKTSKQITYNWVFDKEGEIRDIHEEDISRIYIDKCTTGIQIYVPKDLRIKEPSSDNSAYELCPSGGTTVNLGETIVLHANYIPSDATNRDVVWTNSNDDKITLVYSNPGNDTGYSRAAVTGKELGETIVRVTTTNGHTASCKVTVLDGNVDTVGCKNKTITVGSSSTMESYYTPYTANKTTFTWSSSNTSVGTINSTTGVVSGNKAGSSTITVTATNGKTGTCTLTVNAKPSSGSSTSTTPVSGNCKCIYYEYEESEKMCTYYDEDCGGEEIKVYGKKVVCLTKTKCVILTDYSRVLRTYWNPHECKLTCPDELVKKLYPGSQFVKTYEDFDNNRCVKVWYCETSKITCITKYINYYC